MKELEVLNKPKDWLKKIVYNIRYGRKFQKFNIDKNFSNMLISRNKDSNGKIIFQLINKSKNQEEFANNIRNYLQSSKSNWYSNTLLIGNITGKYVFNSWDWFNYDSLKDLNIDAFTKENQDLIQSLRLHFREYIINDNKRKNTFAPRINGFKDLSQDNNEKKIVEDFDKIIEGHDVHVASDETKVVIKYLIKTIGTYSKEDIKNNFDFILYDIDKGDTDSLAERRKKYFLHKSLSTNQLKKIDELNILKQRLQKIKGNNSENLLLRINKIEGSLDENISELEDIYSDYEVLYRQDLIDGLYTPDKDVTIIENYKDVKPQLIHQFIRNPQKFRNMEIEKIKDKIISERINKDTSKELTIYEQKKLKELIYQVDANLDQYKVNYTTDGKGTTYSDSCGFDRYHSDTTNQISASVFKGEEFINSSSMGIVGIGFNSETIVPEAIAISSNNYKTTNKGLNNLEYNEENEFAEMSAPLPELLKARGKSEIVMHRRGIDFDTKASYIFALIDSSNKKQTTEIMEELDDVKEKEKLKVVIYDVHKIRESLKQIEQDKDNEKEI